MKTNSPSALEILKLSFLGVVLFTLPSVGVLAGDNGTTDATATAGGSAADSNDDELAEKLANPLAAMISVPFQSNFDFGGGPDGDGFQWKMNVQPVIPLTINEDWNLIVRSILHYFL